MVWLGGGGGGGGGFFTSLTLQGRRCVAPAVNVVGCWRRGGLQFDRSQLGLDFILYVRINYVILVGGWRCARGREGLGGGEGDVRGRG